MPRRHHFAPGLFFLMGWVVVSVAQADDAMGEKLHQLLEEAWEFDVREDPLWATQTGDHRFNDKLPSVSVADSRRRLAVKQRQYDRLEKIDRAKLIPADQTHYDIFRRLLRDEIAEFEFESYLIPITNRGGFHVAFPELRRRVPLETVKDYENYIARLAAFDEYAAQHIEVMRAGIEAERTLPSVVLEGFREPISAHVVSDPERSLMFEPFKKFPTAFSDADRERLTEAGRQAIAKGVVPGYQNFLTFMEKEYVPAARGSIGASAMPRGRAFYRHRVRRFTTLNLTPEEVHKTGLSEVKRIRGEMDAIINKVGFDGDFAEFVEYLRGEESFYADTPEQLMKETSYILKKMDGRLPRLFNRLPRTPYGLRQVPEYIASRTSSAYYMPPTGDGARAGFFFINTYDLASRPLYGLEALALHEAVPGHHLQIALQQEMVDMPKFRRFAGFTAFIEGWGLYAERLGLEVGFYEDPYSDFGRLTYEMWRACRLVVDTGIHYFGWTRAQAIRFMADNSALAMHNIRAEVDRYISWPGQALAYKTGELKIRQLRKMAERRLGDRFDVREFHDVVLRGGAVPLTVLERNVKEYVESVGTSSN